MTRDDLTHYFFTLLAFLVPVGFFWLIGLWEKQQNRRMPRPQYRAPSGDGWQV
jgi:hypothetical protein